jgi:hypothetical protein
MQPLRRTEDIPGKRMRDHNAIGNGDAEHKFTLLANSLAAPLCIR